MEIAEKIIDNKNLEREELIIFVTDTFILAW